MSEVTDRPDLDLSVLPSWLQEGLASSASETLPPPIPPSVTELRGTPAWKLALDAAMVSSFLPKELAPSISGAVREESERSVLEFATKIHDRSALRWTLSPDARTAVITASTAEELEAAAARTKAPFSDLVSDAIRECAFEREPKPLEGRDLASLEAMRTAVTMLATTDQLITPSLDKLDREIQLRRLLAGFERMTGTRSGVSNDAKVDRFFGRKDDLDALRDHVDVIPADSLTSKIGRYLERVKRAVRGSPPLIVWGIGGVGKTTLMAKFMLEHARAAIDRYPFAYLDFDRSTVSARDPIGLLVEMCRQVAVQFEELSRPLDALAVSLGEAARRSGSDVSRAASILIPYQRQFREQLDTFLEDIETKEKGRLRPFLLVFDTFEVVQYSPEDVGILENFVASFANQDESGLWSRLRLVITGRRAVPQFLGKVKERRLGPLDQKASAEMLRTLTADLGLEMTRDDAMRLVKALAKAGGNSKEGVHPLRLRIVGEVLGQLVDEAKGKPETLTGKSVVDSLVADLTDPKSVGGVKAALINGFLVRRILGHLVDKRVRALADPGLIVRLITPSVITQVLAKAGPEPVSHAEGQLDSLDFKPWDIDQNAAGEIFEAFRREVTLIDVDGEALRYRQDVRRETLPLIRESRPNRFLHLQEVAWQYFSTLASANKTDLVSAAEAVYHGLWLKKPLDEVDAYWRGPSFPPRIDPEEFEPASLSATYLRAKALEWLDAEELRALGQRLALEWLERRQERLLQDGRVNDTVASVRAAAGEDFRSLWENPALSATISRLLFRAGEWDASSRLLSHPLSVAQPTSLDVASHTSLLRTQTTIAAKTGNAKGLKAFPFTIAMVRDPISRVELLAHESALSGGEASRFGSLDEAIGKVDPNQWRPEPRILRLAILLGTAERRRLIALYIDAIDRLPRSQSTGEVVRRVFGAAYEKASDSSTQKLYGQMMSAPDQLSVMDAADAIFHKDKRPLLEGVDERDDLVEDALKIIVADHYDWTRPLAAALERLMKLQKGIPERIAKIVTELGKPEGRSGRKRRNPSAIDIVAAATDDGSLLLLAQALVEIDATESSGDYPSTAGALADALLSWDERLNLRIDQTIDRASTSARASKTRPKPRPRRK